MQFEVTSFALAKYFSGNYYMLHWLYFTLPSFIRSLFEFCAVNLKANSYVSLFISGGNGGRGFASLIVRATNSS